MVTNTPRRAVLPRLTERRQIGNLGTVSPCCLGLVARREAVPAAFDAGVNFFFLTADYHWPLYEELRLGLRDLLSRGGGIRDDIVIAAVSYVTQPEFSEAPFDDLLTALPDLGHVDLKIAGGIVGPESARRIPLYRGATRHGRGGRQLGVGASFHSRQLAAEHLKEGTIDISYIRYNPPYYKKVTSDILCHVTEQTTGLRYVFGTTAGFFSADDYTSFSVPRRCWRPNITDYYKFALQDTRVHGLLCSLGSAAHVDALGSALESDPLTNDQLEYISDLGELVLGVSAVQTGDAPLGGVP